jgi:hypothetical protein
VRETTTCDLIDSVLTRVAECARHARCLSKFETFPNAKK